MFFNSDNFSPSARKRLLSNYLGESEEFAIADFYPAHVRIYVDGILGHAYQVITEKEGPYVERTISPDPAWWCSRFCHYASRVLTGQAQYNGVLECMDYFLSALPHATDEYHRKDTKIDQMLDAAKALNDSGQAAASPSLSAFAHRLLAHEQQIQRDWEVKA